MGNAARGGAGSAAGFPTLVETTRSPQATASRMEMQKACSHRVSIG